MGYEKFKRLSYGVESGNCDVLEVYDAWKREEHIVKVNDTYFYPETMREMGYKRVKIAVIEEGLVNY